MIKKIEQIIEYTKALIYCRVSSDRQVKEGHGLDSQEARCKQRAEEMGLKVAAIFRDEGISGSLFDRPKMQELLDYLDKHPTEYFVVIFDDLARFARDVEVHIKLRSEFGARQAKLECLNLKLTDTEEGELVEMMMAAVNQYQRKSNKRTVRQRQKARLESGEWPFCFPVALKNRKDRKNKVIVEYLVNVEPLATIYKTAIEKFVKYELETKESMRQYILEQYAIHGIERKLSDHGVDNILREILYTGWIEYEPWDISLRKGKHKGFISLETHQTALKRLAEIAKPRLRTDYNLDFPLRNYLLCPFCKRPMTASWHKGKMNKKYPHYWCKTKGCTNQNKSVQRDKAEADFQQVMKSVIPQAEVMQVADMVLEDLWNQRQELEVRQNKRITKEADTLQTEADAYKARIAKAKSDMAADEYEAEMVKILHQKEDLIAKNKHQIKYPNEKFGTAKKIVFEVIKNPLSTWEKGNYEDKRLLLNMYFRHGIAYDKKTGFGTLTLPLILKVLSSPNTTKKTLVEYTEHSENLFSRLLGGKIFFGNFDLMTPRSARHSAMMFFAECKPRPADCISPPCGGRKNLYSLWYFKFV